jgi:DNA-binding response OmpR family regulator
MRHDRVITREALIQAVYGFDDEIESNTLEAQLSRLRKKLVSSFAILIRSFCWLSHSRQS